MTRSVAAILLAAGKSRRMGSCKQLLPLCGSTVIARCLDALIAGGVEELLAVVSEDGRHVAAAVQDYPAKIVVNPECDGDMASSVRAGRDALKTDASGVIIALCDYPLVTADTITRLMAAHKDSPDSIIIPCCLGRRGHPILFPRTVLDELEEDLNLRDLVRSDPKRIICLDVDDQGVLFDMDTPDDYLKICTIDKSLRGISKGV